jgi:hypothetical protein
MLASSRSEVHFAPLAFLFPPWGSPRCKSDKDPILGELPTGHGRAAGGGIRAPLGPGCALHPGPALLSARSRVAGQARGRPGPR